MTNYPSNLSDSQWQFISKYLDAQRNRRYELREIVNAILYLVKTGVNGECFRGILHRGNWFIIILTNGKAGTF